MTEPSETSQSTPLYIVGIGASAGGLSALETLFSRLPVNTGMTYVVIQHLSPHFKSLMDDLLARHTRMPIHIAGQGMQVEPNTIYLIPPNKQMTLNGRAFDLSERNQGSVDLPIDVFLNSLARSARGEAIAVILSGTGTDGSRGIRAVRNEGGLVLVQAPETAQFDGMPRSALATGICDHAADPAQLAEILSSFAKDAAAERTRLAQTRDGDISGRELTAIFDRLQAGFDIDFSRYKMATVARRIRRRMDFIPIRDVDEYAAYLEASPAELEALYHDLLIGVTEFFRDPDHFEFVGREILPELLRESRPDEGVRIWSAGCATGEEAYSLAIIASEAAEATGFDGRISVFATDVHRASLELASAGRYEGQRLANVSPHRLARYFRREDDGFYRISSNIRKSVIFATHNLAKDAPFGKLDLISCRNLLIYLQPELQQRAISTFHFALRSRGILFLGPSEAPGLDGAVFETLDAHRKIFRKCNERMAPQSKARSLLEPVPKPLVPLIPLASRTVSIDRQLLHDYDAILGRQAPGVIIDENRQVLHYCGDIARYLSPAQGRPATDLFDLVDGDLQLGLCTTLPKAENSNDAVVLRSVRVKPAGAEEVLVDVVIDPIPDPRSRARHYHIHFAGMRPAIAPPEEPHTAVEFEAGSHHEQLVADLRNELRSTKENLQSAVEELQASNEEMQSTNEELLASNEELQSTNEELQSVNEELYTVNTEFERKNAELAQINLDYDNLLASIQVGIIFLDKNLRIRKYNDFVKICLKLLPQDLGRPIDHIAYDLEGGRKISEDARVVLEDGIVREKELVCADGTVLLKRILPFRNEQNHVEGAVLTFTDVTSLKQAERALAEMNADLERAVNDRTEQLRRSNQDLQAYAYTVSHDLQEPLRNITTFIDLLDHRYGERLNGEGREFMTVIRTGAERMQAMLTSLLKYSRAGQDHSERVKVDSGEVLRTVLENLAVRLREADADIKVGPMPVVYAWEGRLNQIFQNLVENAVKYRKPGERAKITISAEQQHDLCVFSVKDNGIGFDMQYAEKIFGVFKRLHNYGEYAGNGMGLAITRRIVERHGGRIWAESAPGQGTTFYFTLPVVSEGEVASAATDGAG